MVQKGKIETFLWEFWQTYFDLKRWRVLSTDKDNTARTFEMKENDTVHEKSLTTIDQL